MLQWTSSQCDLYENEIVNIRVQKESECEQVDNEDFYFEKMRTIQTIRVV